MKRWLVRGLTTGGEEIEAETSDEARIVFAKRYPHRTNGGNPKCTSQPILTGETN